MHDQLIASGGSDNVVNLWRIASCSSAPWLGGDDGDGNDDDDGNNDQDNNSSNSSNQDGDGGVEADPPNIKVRTIDQHEESIYSIAWSPADAWMYCSLSYDGRVILNHVPSTEKYKILL